MGASWHWVLPSMTSLTGNSVDNFQMSPFSFVGVVLGREINRLFCKHRPNLMFTKGVKVRPPRVIKWPWVI